jgi:PleD family two-component response regulator
MTRPCARVLDVGNCDPDHHMIRMMLERHVDVELDRVMFVDEALAAMRKTRYDLVLVNRLIFEDGSEGLNLTRRARADAALADIPIMLVSNFAEAQQASIEAGGVLGFGKSALFAEPTLERLAEYLPPKKVRSPKH